MTLAHKRMTILAAFAFLLAAVFFPVPIAAWFSILAPAEHHSGAWKIISHGATVWAHHRGYLPWRTWPVLFHHPHGLLTWVIAALAWTGMFIYMGRDRNRGRSDWGGPPPAGHGEHGTARWRKSSEMTPDFELWDAALLKEGADNGP